MGEGSGKVVVFGLGGGGCRIVARLCGYDLSDEFLCITADTDRRSIEEMKSIDGATPLLLGEEWTSGEGTGGDPLTGERAVSASVDAIRKHVEKARLLLVVCALGGGTGTGGARVLARLARENNLTTVFVCTMPFAFEGNWRRRQADECLEPLRSLIDTVIVVPNDLLFNVLPADTPAPEAFNTADRYLAQALGGLGQLTVARGLLQADFASIRTVLRRRQSTSMFGVGQGSGENRWKEALDDFLKCPLIGGQENLQTAHAAVITILGDENLTIGDIQSCMSSLQRCFTDDTKLIVGAYTKAGQKDVRLTALICRYQDEPLTRQRPEMGVPPAQGKRGGNGKKKTSARSVQGELPLQEQSLGVFAASQPTIVSGQNLDIPTFQRRGLHLDTGD